MVRLVLFDIDGTLIRTSGAGVKAFAAVFRSEFNAVDGFEKLKFSGRTDVSLVREFFGFHGIACTPENLSFSKPSTALNSERNTAANAFTPAPLVRINVPSISNRTKRTMNDYSKP